MKSISHLKSKLFIKYFTSYMCLFLFMFLFFGLYIYNSTIKNLSIELEELNNAKLTQIEMTVSNKFREIRNMGNRMGADQSFFPSTIQKNLYNDNTMNELKKYKENNTWIEEIYLNYGDKIVYSSNGMMSVDAMTSNTHFFHNYDVSALIEDFNSNGEIIKSINYPYSSTNKEGTKIAYFMPLRTGAGGNFGQIFFLLSSEELMTHLESIANATTFVLDPNKEIILLSSKQISAKELNDSGLLEENVLPKNEISLDEEIYVLSTTESPYLGWIYGSLIEAEQFFAPITSTYRNYFTILFLLLLVGIFSSLAFSLYHYKPLNKLFQSLRKPSNELNSESERLNKLESLDDAVNEIISENKELQSEIDSHQPLIRNQLITRLLEGNITKKQTEELLNKNNLKFHSNFYMVATIKIEELQLNKLNISVHELITDKYSDYIWSKTIVNALILDYKQEIVLVIGLNEDNITDMNQDYIREVISHIKEELKMFLGKQIILGVGMIYEDLNKIKQSYIESVAALEYTFHNPNQQLLFFEDINKLTESDFTFLPHQLVLRLKQSLMEADEEIAKESLMAIHSYLTKKRFTLNEIKYALFEVIQMIINYALENNIIGIKEDMDIMLETSSIDDLFKLLREYITKICVNKKRSSEMDKYNITSDILDYIEENYLSQSVSLEEIASIFNLSLSYVSRLIKEHKGISFSNYLQELRMEEFKRRLINTDEPIKNIVQDIGYIDASNFTRKFKKIYGVTPSQFRMTNR